MMFFTTFSEKTKNLFTAFQPLARTLMPLIIFCAVIEKRKSNSWILFPQEKSFKMVLTPLETERTTNNTVLELHNSTLWLYRHHYEFSHFRINEVLMVFPQNISVSNCEVSVILILTNYGPISVLYDIAKLLNSLVQLYLSICQKLYRSIWMQF